MRRLTRRGFGRLLTGVVAAMVPPIRGATAAAAGEGISIADSDTLSWGGEDIHITWDYDYIRRWPVDSVGLLKGRGLQWLAPTVGGDREA